MSVKRYCPTGCEVGCDVYCTPVGMVENAGGDYVRYIDFASVKAERDALSAELAGHTHEVFEGEDRVTCDEAVAYWRELGESAQDRACANEVLIHGVLARLRTEKAAATARAEAAEAKLAEVAEHVRETTELDADTMARRVLAILNRKPTPCGEGWS